MKHFRSSHFGRDRETMCHLCATDEAREDANFARDTSTYGSMYHTCLKAPEKVVELR